MKHFLFGLLFILSCTECISQNIQDGIWGCKYGSSKRGVTEAIKKQGYLYTDKGKEIEIQLPKFGGIEFDRAILYFYLDKYYMASFSKSIDSVKSAEATYNYLKENLANKYGVTQEVRENSMKTIFYSDRDNSIKLDFVDYSNSPFRTKVGNNYFICSGFICLTYWNSPILKEAINEL